jgi:hypothetical protein
VSHVLRPGDIAMTGDGATVLVKAVATEHGTVVWPNGGITGMELAGLRWTGQRVAPVPQTQKEWRDAGSSIAPFPFPLADPVPPPMLVTTPCGCTSMDLDGQLVQVSWCVKHDRGYQP